jgi:serine/threonine protein kinase
MWLGKYSYIMFPLLTNGSLVDFLIKGSNLGRMLSLDLQRYICKQICMALLYMSKVDLMAHGDIKGDNIMITDDYRMILIDLGFSEKKDKIIRHYTGTPVYNGPEIDEVNEYSIAKSDLHALGVTLFTIMFQDIPFGKDPLVAKEFRENYLVNP